MSFGKLWEHAYILASIGFTVFSQLVMRWQVTNAGELPVSNMGKVQFVGALLLNPWVIIAVLATFLAGVSWMLAMTRFEVSYAYPFVGMSFILIMLLSSLLFGESLGFYKILGTVLVVVGIIVTTLEGAK